MKEEKDLRWSLKNEWDLVDRIEGAAKHFMQANWE